MPARLLRFSRGKRRPVLDPWLARSTVEIARRYASDVEALARGDVEAWRALFARLEAECVKPGAVAPNEVVVAMLEAHPTLDEWVAIARGAGKRLQRPDLVPEFRDWFANGMRALPETHAIKLEFRYQLLRSQVDDAALTATSALVSDMRASNVSKELLADALLLFALRLDEANVHAAGIAAAIEAAALHASPRATRFRAGFLVRARRVDEALALLRDLEISDDLEHPVMRERAPADALAQALDHLADVVRGFRTR